MGKWWKAFTQDRRVAHLLRANTRYQNRMGNQFAGAATYFSVLALVPILMFAFSMLGMTLTVLRPDLLVRVKDEVNNFLGSENKQFGNLIDDYLRNWRAVGLFGLVSLIYAGSGWVGNLRTSIRALWRPDFDYDDRSRHFAVNWVINIGMLFVLLVGCGVTFTLTIGATTLSNRAAHWLGLEHTTAGRMAMRGMALLLTVLAGFALFFFIYWLLPRRPAPLKARLVGSAIAGVLLAVLQAGAGVLIRIFSQNKSAALFGPIIIMMLFFNLFARLVLFIACWIATTNQPAVAYHYSPEDEPLRHDPSVEVALGHWEQAEPERRLKRFGIKEPLKPRPLLREPERPAPLTSEEFTLRALDNPPRPDPDVLVPQDVAVRTVRTGMVAGWVAGAAAGIGIGAATVRGLLRRRR